MRLDQEVEWEKISTERGATLPPGEYVAVVKEVEDDTSENNVPFSVIKSEVTEGEHLGREIWDRIYLKTKKGGVNKIGMGQIKEWALATVGAERLASPEFDTKEFEGQTVRILTEETTYEKENADGTKTSKKGSQVKKVLRY